MSNTPLPAAYVVLARTSDGYGPNAAHYALCAVQCSYCDRLHVFKRSAWALRTRKAPLCDTCQQTLAYVKSLVDAAEHIPYRDFVARYGTPEGMPTALPLTVPTLISDSSQAVLSNSQVDLLLAAVGQLVQTVEAQQQGLRDLRAAHDDLARRLDQLLSATTRLVTLDAFLQAVYTKGGPSEK